MKKILSDYRRSAMIVPIQCLVYCVVFFAAVTFIGQFQSGRFREISRIVSAAILLYAAFVALNTLVFECARFKKKLSRLPRSESAAVLAQYDNSPAINKWHFLEEYLLVFIGTRIVLQKLSEVRSAELKGGKLLLRTDAKKPVKLTLWQGENPAILVAAMRSKNPDISVIINGKLVEKMENKK